MEELLEKFLNFGWIDRKDKVLVICGNNNDDQVLKKLKFSNYLITSAYKKHPGIRNYRKADAQRLPFPDLSFDVSIVNLGLHHCGSPHQALCEMYRVARKVVIVHEAQDSWLIRLLVKLRFILDYETVAIVNKGGGVNNTAVPNFVYRWNRREVKKVLNSFDPTKIHQINFYTGFNFYDSFLASGGYWEDKFIVKVIGKRLTKIAMTMTVLLLNLVGKSQGNDFAFIVRKDVSLLKSWINGKKSIREMKIQ